MLDEVPVYFCACGNRCLHEHGSMFIKATCPASRQVPNTAWKYRGASHIFCALPGAIKLDSSPLLDFALAPARLHFARKGGARYRRIPDSRFPSAASRACGSCGVATTPGPLPEAEACTEGGEAQSRRSRRARLWALGGGVRATRVRGRLGARLHLPGPSVCLPTNCHHSAATHSDALNKRPALAICFPLPRRALAAWGHADPRDAQSANTGSESPKRL